MSSSYNSDWIFPKLRCPTRIWHIASTVTIAAVGLFSKIITVWLNKTKVHNVHILRDTLDQKPRDTPLLTVSNHHSCFDDPGIWGVLPLRQVCNHNKIRWSLAAHDICFTNKYHSIFFMCGKCIPVVRGAGVYQPAVDLCIQKLSLGDWVHIFPEGKVNMTKEKLRFKWGIGRIIYESPILPIIIPIWHEGMDTVLPNYPPYFLKFGKKITVNIGEPIDLKLMVDDLKLRNVPEEDARKIITDKIQEEMMEPSPIIRSSPSNQQQRRQHQQQQKMNNDLCVDTPEHKHFLNRALNNCTANKILGRGSYGTVFKAFYRDKPVAVKLINHSSDEMNYNSVISESHICGWNHKNIIKIMIIKKIWNYTIIIMERISGYSLQYLLDHQRSISLRHCCRIILDVSQALAFCHKNHLIHLDVKPQNILIQFNDEHSTDKYVCKLCDFGSSQCIYQNNNNNNNSNNHNNFNNYNCEDGHRHDHRDLNEKFKNSGTIRYMSPELLQGLQPMPTDDIYSLGITMWQLKSNYDPYHLIQSNDIIAYRVVKYNLRPDVNIRVFNSRDTKNDHQIQITKLFANNLNNKNNKSLSGSLTFHWTPINSHRYSLISSYSSDENRFKKIISNSTINLNSNKSNDVTSTHHHHQHHHHHHHHILERSNNIKKKLCFNKKLILNNNTNTNNNNNNRNLLVLKRKQDIANLNVELKNDKYQKLSQSNKESNLIDDQFHENPGDVKFSNRNSIRYIELYRKCWSVDCTKRPSATEIILILNNFF